MKQHGKIFAGLLSVAVMLQNAAALPFVPAPTALSQCLDYANYRTHLGLLYYEGDVYSKLK